MNREQFWMKQYEIMRDKYFELVETTMKAEWSAGYATGTKEERETAISLAGIIEEAD